MHDFLTSGSFWFLEGILACLTLIGLAVWMEDRGIPMPLWKWGLVACWFLGLGFTVAFVGTCLGEGERHAAARGGVVFGTLVTIAGVVILRLLRAGSSPRNQ